MEPVIYSPSGYRSVKAIPRERGEAPEESHVVSFIHPEAEPVPLSIDVGAWEIVRRVRFRPTASRVCARAA